ncbi:MAG: cyclic nucleotide-binding domain-containing protein [Alphaproteobacteria bacterium]|nr:cyclic nucleotide-binding domain-containing protein [Alphaproteobacteria bacterium]
MSWERLYRILQPETSGNAARAFRFVHHAMVVLGIAVMLADTVASWRKAHQTLLDAGFQAVCVFFIAEYLTRLGASVAAPGAHRGRWRARLAWVTSPSGVFDLLGAMPGILDIAFSPAYASLYGFVWAFKPARYSSGLAGLRRVVSRARDALLSVLLAFGIVLLAAASLAYLLERNAQPQLFGSIPQALWWAIVTLTTTGYGDVVPMTTAGKILGGVVMAAGILVFALAAGILATGYAEELRRREFLRTWDLVAKVPFFKNVGASAIADVARLLRARDYPSRAVIVRRGENGDCMYFIAEGEVEVRLRPGTVRLGPGDFFGEMALLTGGPRTATIVAAQPCTLLSLDIVDFRQLLGRQAELARVVHEEAERRRVVNEEAERSRATRGARRAGSPSRREPNLPADQAAPPSPGPANGS